MGVLLQTEKRRLQNCDGNIVSFPWTSSSVLILIQNYGSEVGSASIFRLRKALELVDPLERAIRTQWSPLFSKLVKNMYLRSDLVLL